MRGGAGGEWENFLYQQSTQKNIIDEKRHSAVPAYEKRRKK